MRHREATLHDCGYWYVPAIDDLLDRLERRDQERSEVYVEQSREIGRRLREEDPLPPDDDRTSPRSSRADSARSGDSPIAWRIGSRR